jgi:hypothetical protein
MLAPKRARQRRKIARNQLELTRQATLGHDQAASARDTTVAIRRKMSATTSATIIWRAWGFMSARVLY